MEREEQSQRLPGLPEGGPFVQMALLCEKVLREADGVLSLVRIIDRIMIAVVGPNAPLQMPPAPVNLALVVSLVPGFARGSATVQIRIVSPSHAVLQTFDLPVLFESDDRPVQAAVALGLQVQEDGVYWFEVRLHEVLLTKAPLRIIYQRLSVSQ